MALDVHHLAQQQQQQARSPAQPSYVFRGHTAQIHAVRILRRNTCLVTGDGDGWVVCWALETKRPQAVWRAHDAAILGVAEWGPDKLITHGRDHTLRIWQWHPVQAPLSILLPVHGPDAYRPKPWLLHSLPVNTLNFCAFALCIEQEDAEVPPGGAASEPPARSSDRICIAVPGRDDKKIEVYQFPDEKLQAVVPRIGQSDTGMVMAVKLVRHRPSNNTLVLAGYEGGFTAVHLIPRTPASIRPSTPNLAQIIYLSQPHTQPILSLDASPDGSYYFTSSADAIIASHRIPEMPLDVNTENFRTGISAADFGSGEATDAGVNIHPNSPASVSHAPSDIITASFGQTSGHKMVVNERVLDSPPAEFIGKGNVQGVSTAEPLDFSKKHIPRAAESSSARPAGLASLLSSAPLPLTQESSPIPAIVPVQPACKIANTKHAGQQSLRMRSDGRLLVTGGWDSRVRIYSTKTLKEVAVLKWHKEGVYAVDFGEVLQEDDLDGHIQPGEQSEIAKRETGLSRLQRQREKRMQLKHFVVAGAKDGKVSLWEVF